MTHNGMNKSHAPRDHCEEGKLKLEKLEHNQGYENVMIIIIKCLKVLFKKSL